MSILSALRPSITTLALLTAIVILGGSSVLAAPPVPFLDENEPGLNFLFSGDPHTTEEGCSQSAPRAAGGGEGGKIHNDLLDCDNWDFQPREWGQASFLQGAFILGESPFSNDGAWACPGNTGGGGVNPCANSTIRAVTTHRNQPSPGEGLNNGVPMSEDKDWVFSFDFRIEIPAGDTYGNDKLFEVNGAGGDTMVVRGAGPDNSSFLSDGTANRYQLSTGFGTTLIDVPLIDGHMTLHYKSKKGKYDLWLNDQRLVRNFASISGSYDADFIQLGGGGISFENALYDNVILGVRAKACGPQGPGISVPGDFNCDGLVDVADLGIIGANFNGSEVTYVEGDANLDGGVDVADLGVVGANWTALQSTGNASALVPEPTTLSLLAMSVLMVGRRRRA